MTEYTYHGDECRKKISDRLESNMNKAVILVHNEATTNHPWKNRTGTLQRSIVMRVEKDRNSIAGFVGTNVFYAKFLELGTDRMPPYPFLYPALEVNKQRIVKLLGGL